MSESPLLSKMDALLKKHRGGSETDVGPSPRHASPPEHAPPPDAWLPVLTDVIERGMPPVVPARAAAPPPPPVVQSAGPEGPVAAVPPSSVADALAEQLMSELAPRLSEAMEKQVTAELRKNLDQTVANLLSQLDVNVREIVRAAIDEKLRQPPGPST